MVPSRSPLISIVLPGALVRMPEPLTDKPPSMLSVAPVWTPRLPSSTSVPVWTVLVPPLIVKPRLDEMVNVPVESPMRLTPLICERSGSTTVPPLVIWSDEALSRAGSAFVEAGQGREH